MNKIKWYQYFGIGAYVAGWISRAFVDNKITRAEIDELVMAILDMLEITEIEIEK